MGPLAVRVFAALFILAGGIVLFFGTKSVSKAKASPEWPTTNGKIVSSSVESKRGDKGSITYRAEVLYEFTVSGSIHSANHVAYGQYGSSDPSLARGIVNKYPPGKEVTVYYSPDSPDECVLEPGITVEAFLFPGIGALFMAAGLLAFLLLPRLFPKQRVTKST